MAVTPWYKYPYTNDYGGSEPFGNYPKPDINIECPDGTPITNLLAGTVTGLNSSDGHIPAWGAVVTLQLDKPVNAVATHIAYLHLEPLPRSLSLGQHLPAGEVIGYSGGQHAQGTEKVPVGVALYHGPIYGEGASWSIYVGSAWLDPTPVLKAAGNSGTGSNVPRTVGEAVQAAKTIINPDETVAQLLAGMDVALQIMNPFDVTNTSSPESAAAAAVGGLLSGALQAAPGGLAVNGAVSFFESIFSNQAPPNPLTYIGDVAEGLIQNFTAVFIRSLFLLFGVMLILIVFQSTWTSAVSGALEKFGGASGIAEMAVL